MVFVGGSLIGDDTRLAMPIKKIPTRNAPKVVKKLLDLYRDEKQGEEHFDVVMQRLGADRIKVELEEFTPIPSFEEDPSFYQDWGHEEEKFEIQQGVKGECAGATVEEKIPTFKDAEKHLEKARAFLHHGELKSSIIESYQACSATAHVPLYTKLVDPFTDEQTIWEFENMLVRTGEADNKWIDIAVRLKEKISMEPTKEIAEELLAIADDMHSECQQIQMNLTQATKN
jgi:sulfite reductase (ferredoxin)